MNKFAHLPSAPNRSRSVARMLGAIGISGFSGEKPNTIIARAFPNDHLALALTRAAVSPTTTSTAPDLLGHLAGTLLAGLAPASAATRLFAECVSLNFAGVHQFSVPYASTVPAPVFVGEGLPYPVGQGVMNRVIVGPVHKMLMGAAVTNELEFATIESATAIIGRLLSEQAGKSLDAALFDNVAASAIRPPGLLNGVNPISATSGAGVNAMTTDLGLLATALATAGCNPDRMVIVAAPAQALVLRLLASPQFTNTIIGTSAVTDKSVVAIDPAAIATGYDGVPSIETSTETVQHFDDTTPLDITTASVGTTVKSLWQTDCIAIRVRMKCCWGVLASGAVQLINSVTW